MWLECDGSSFHSETNFKTGETGLKYGEKPTLLCRTGTKPLTGIAVEKTELNFSSNDSRSSSINYARYIKRNKNQLCGYIPIKPARLTGIPGSKRRRVKRHLKLASPAHAISSKRLMTLNDSLDSIGWAKSYHVKDYHMREVKHERNWTGLFSISRRILQRSMIVMRLNSLNKFSFIDLVINWIA